MPENEPKCRNIKILKTIRVVGTENPGNVPILSEPPTRLGNDPILVVALSNPFVSG